MEFQRDSEFQELLIQSVVTAATGQLLTWGQGLRHIAVSWRREKYRAILLLYVFQMCEEAAYRSWVVENPKE